jgi:hypothetical protein
MTQTGNLAAFDLDEKAIIFDLLNSALDLLSFVEV